MSLLLIFNSEGSSLSLVVEDGSGKADADSFVELSIFKTYCQAMGYSLTGYADEADIEPALRRGTRYISNGIAWPGQRTHGRAQSLQHPRIGLTDAEGLDIASDEVAIEVRQATCEAAFYELGNPNGLNPSVTLADRVKSEKVGSIAVEYTASASTVDAARPVLTIIQDILAPLLRGQGSNPLVGTAVRR